MEYYQIVVEEQYRNSQAWCHKSVAELEIGGTEEAITSLENTGINKPLYEDLPDIAESKIKQLSTNIELRQNDSARKDVE